MKVLTLCTDYLPNIGGISNHIFYLNKYLLQKGIDAKILHIVEKSNKNHLLFEEDTTSENSVYKLYIKDDLSKFKKLKYKRIITDIIKENFPDTDIIHTHEFKTTEYLVPKGYKWIWTNHTSQFFNFVSSCSMKDKILFPLVKNKFMRADHIITVSTLYQKETSKIFDNDISMIPNGIEIKKNISFQDNFNFPKNKIKILIPARWSKVKGIHIAIELMIRLEKDNQLNDLLFIFAGSGLYDDEVYHHQLLHKIERFKNKILFDKVEYSQMSNLYQSVDIVLIPSLFESASIVALEGMVAKKIVIASNVGGLPELIKDKERGCLFEKENMEDLMTKLLYVILNIKSEKYNKIRESGYLFCLENYDWSKITDKTIDVYNQVLK